MSFCVRSQYMDFSTASRKNEPNRTPCDIRPKARHFIQAIDHRPLKSVWLDRQSPPRSVFSLLDQ